MENEWFKIFVYQYALEGTHVITDVWVWYQAEQIGKSKLADNKRGKNSPVTSCNF